MHGENEFGDSLHCTTLQNEAKHFQDESQQLAGKCLTSVYPLGLIFPITFFYGHRPKKLTYAVEKNRQLFCRSIEEIVEVVSTSSTKARLL